MKNYWQYKTTLNLQNYQTSFLPSLFFFLHNFAQSLSKLYYTPNTLQTALKYMSIFFSQRWRFVCCCRCSRSLLYTKRKKSTWGKESPSITAINDTRLPSLSLRTSANSISFLRTLPLMPRSPAATTNVATQCLTLENLKERGKARVITDGLRLKRKHSVELKYFFLPEKWTKLWQPEWRRSLTFLKYIWFFYILMGS